MRNLENLNSYTLLTTFYQSWIPIIQNLISLFSKILLQAEAHRKAKEEAVVSHHEKMKLEILKQKARQDQTAVASPEVKKHLADFVLAKKRKEASAVSMSNLKMVPNVGNTAPPHHALLRKTASESNLLKMKHGKRIGPHGIASPYQRASGLCHQPAIPENEVQGGSLQVHTLISVRSWNFKDGGS